MVVRWQDLIGRPLMDDVTTLPTVPLPPSAHTV